MRGDIKTFLTIVLLTTCYCTAPARTVDGNPERVVRAVLDSKRAGVWVEGAVDKELSRTGDRACVALTKVIAGRKLNSIEMERALLVVHLSFGAPKIVRRQSRSGAKDGSVCAELASPAPPDSKQEKIRAAIGVLRSKTSSEEEKFDAMMVLGNLRAEEAIPDLVHFLDLRREYPWERAGDVIGEMPMITAVSRFPAVSALVAIGEPALPALLEVVAASKPDDLRSVNARLAFETIFRDDLAKGVEAIRKAATRESDGLRAQRPIKFADD